MDEISDFVSLGPVEPEIIEAYRDRVPAELVEIWERYGYGTFGEGFIRVINPRVYEEALSGLLGKVTGNGISIPIFVTAMADILSWEPGTGMAALMFRDGHIEGLGSKLDTFFNLLALDGALHLADELNWDLFPHAVEAHGEPAFDESFMFVRLLSRGGPAAVENMHKRDTLESIKFMVELQGPIEHQRTRQEPWMTDPVRASISISMSSDAPAGTMSNAYWTFPSSLPSIFHEVIVPAC